MPDLVCHFLKSPLTWQIALAGYWLALFVATHVSNDMPLLPSSNGFDKLAHVAAFALLATLLATAWQLAAGRLTVRHLGAVWLVVILYAAFDEWTQAPVGRDASIWDWAADVLGALTALIIFAWLNSNFRGKETRQ